jgi:Raf kinase inhibitor-like YbhB/YbcL family protein
MQPPSESESTSTVPTGTLIVSSPAFGMNDVIPIEFTADGDNVAPPLAWTPPPPGTKSIAILVEDPDAPSKIWVHWIAVNIPPEVTEIPAGGQLPDGAVHGTNDFGEEGWGGPNPPSGLHRYFFRVFALDNRPHKPGMTKPDLMSAIKGHILARGEMIGTYAHNVHNHRKTSNEAPVKRVGWRS